ncbi:hypothetical protein C8N35_111108 [Breoghania corrubedonensis]|uniref:Uncharacterized protein n=1 Tax=Breoghania corrubedonensis TaxID=665038 RepID=A0A2T5UYR0_9HYPH|nr:hypothetical protein [Breoghania corrubedonensis]PTW56645.1 hypothetical protein C8N35_111108 [Breoghania corrubedonensis]
MTDINRASPNHTSHRNSPGETGREGHADTRFSNGGSGRGSTDARDTPRGSGSGAGEKQKPGADLEDRLARFEERLTRGQGEGHGGDKGRDYGKGLGGKDDGDAFVLLASLEVPLSAGSAPRALRQGPPPQGDLKARIETILQTITPRLDAALRPGPCVAPTAITLNIPADNGATALTGFNVTMDGTTLTVALVFREGANPADPDNRLLAAAAQLAHALQARYPRHGVKILKGIRSTSGDGSGAEAPSHSDAGFELASLLRQAERAR